jgi:dual oxidase
LPVLLNENVTAYTGYNRHLPPGVSHSFATTAFRFPHTIVPPAMFLRSKTKKCEYRKDVVGFTALRLCQNWYLQNLKIINLKFGSCLLNLTNMLDLKLYLLI